MKNTIRLMLMSSALATALATSLPAYSADAQKERSGAPAAQPQQPCSYGPGMMGGYGMGPGMMGGYGMGPGMMGGYGMGPGMMGGYWGRNEALTDAQQAELNKITDETRKANWSTMSAMMDEQARLRDLYAAPKRDDAAIGEAYKKLDQLRQQMLDRSVNANKRMEAVLSKGR